MKRSNNWRGQNEILTTQSITRCCCFLFIGLLFLQIGFAQEQMVGNGSYNLSPPTGQNVPQDGTGQEAFPVVTSNFNQPIQTNDWWTTLLYKYTQNQTFNWEIHSWKLYAHPLAALATRYGLDIRYPNVPSVSDYYGMTNAKYQYPLDIKDFSVGIENMDLGTTDTCKVEAYGDWHVKMVWDDQAGHELKATMAHGSPYIFFEKNSSDSAYVRLFFSHSIDHMIGTNIIGFTTQGHHYGLFAPSGSSWNTNAAIEQDENAFVGNAPIMQYRAAFKSDLNGGDYFTIAILPDNSLATLQNFAQHAFSFIEDTNVSWNYDEINAELTTTFSTTCIAKEGTSTDTYQALYRHQWLNSTDVNSSYEYDSPRGSMKVVEGNSFTTVLKNNGIIPAIPKVLSTARKAELYQFIEDEFQVVNTYVTQEDTYWMGKRLGRQADLIQIAHQVGHTAARDKFIADLKVELEDWFTALDGETDRGYFYYDDNWNTLIGYPASFGADIRITDHHFHYGYFIKAAATIAQFDPAWAASSAWGGMLELLIKDANNWDKSDTQFPFLRCFDAYAGHSWASGHGSSHWGNDQESSSEAMNFAAYTFFWGLETENTTIRDLGIYLYLTEASAIEQYWLDQDEAVFPSIYPYETATRIWGNGVDKIAGGEPWEMESAYQIGINTIPIEAPLLYLGKRPDLMETIHSEATTLNTGIGNTWEDVMWSIQALYNPNLAIADYEAHTSSGAYTTNVPWLPNVWGIYNDFSDYSYAPAQLYHWLYSLDSLGQVDASVCSDALSSLVFKNGNVQHYCVYNPSSMPITVNFSDGEIVNVPSDTLYLHRKDNLVCDNGSSFILDETMPLGLYQAGTISTLGTISTDTNVDLEAGISIELNSGFCVPMGSEFSAEILDCGGN